MVTDNAIVLSKIKSAVREIDPTAELILYGSRARGDEHPDSDWDLLILVNSKTDLKHESIFRHKLYDIELDLGVSLSTTVHNKDEWSSKYWMTPLYHNITREGLRI